MKILNYYNFIQLLLILMISVFLISSCARAKLTVRSPAEINTMGINNVAVGKFEIASIMLKFKTERNGVWETHPITIGEAQKKSIGRSVRARVVNLLTSTPYFRVIFTDEFEKLEDDYQMQQLVLVTSSQLRTLHFNHFNKQRLPK